MTTFPDFRAVSTLTEHIAHTMRFYHPRCIDRSGGFYHYFKDDGQVYDVTTRHLVSSTRFVFNYAMAYRQFSDPQYLDMVKHGVAFLRDVHRDPVNGGYAWQVSWDNGNRHIIDNNNHCYGLAFVLLAYSHAVMAGMNEARTYLDETVALMEDKFWLPEFDLYADQASADWSHLDTYRGQNANMHSCEAMLAAYQATGELMHLHRAEAIAKSITQRQASQAGGMIWEHYDYAWQIDWKYNLEDKANLFRPWGFQPGHFTEWSKLLVLLDAQAANLQGDSAWILPTAERLFDTALDLAWDTEHGGIYYGFAPDHSICDGDKYFWVQAESIAAAACLAQRTGKQKYWDWYDKIWQYSWMHFVDHQYGAWYRILDKSNLKISDEKSPAGKSDYHTMGACYEVLNVLNLGKHHV
ncbi:AGE family epimerase/isomerase [Undibacterium sp. TJN19]|uniref:AGE family epimerase/isomerase n=1 Tax=Undibacterium sp. TJN19 TaxID=3413055 RepID=UPI003BEF96AA